MLRYAFVFPIVLLAVPWGAADIIQFGTTDQHGTGFGTVNSFLSLQHNGQSGLESGSTFRSSAGGGSNGSSGDATNGGEVRTVALLMSLGINTTSQLGIVYNLNEAGSDPRNILEEMSLTIYSPGGTALFTASYAGPALDLPVLNQGTGGAGYVFILGTTEAAAAQAFYQPANYIGMAATIDDSEDGPDNFYPIAIPEPASLLALLAGLLLIRIRP